MEDERFETISKEYQDRFNEPVPCWGEWGNGEAYGTTEHVNLLRKAIDSGKPIKVEYIKDALY